MKKAALLFASLVFVGREAGADAQRTSSLAWVRLEGADACIAGPQLARAVEARLGRKVFVSATDADITLEGAIGPARPSGFRATLKVTGRDGNVIGTREVETRSTKCDAIDDKLALVVSVMIDPDAEGPAPAPPPEPPPPQVIERERVVVVREAAPPPPPEKKWSVELGVAGTSSVGMQPNVGLGIAPEVVLRPPLFFALVASGGLTFATSVPAERGASIEGSLAHGSLSFCPLVLTNGALTGLACAGALLSSLRSRGVGFDTTQSGSSFAAGPTATARVSFAFAGPLYFAASAGLVVSIARAELSYRTTSGESTVFRTAVVAGTADLGVGVRLP